MTSDDRTANLLGALALTLSDRAGAAVHARAGVSGSDAAALVTLRNYAEGEPLDLLRRALALSHPAVVRLADRLQARGLVERHRSASDGRAVALRLTAAGRRAADAALGARPGPSPRPWAPSSPPSAAPWLPCWSACSAPRPPTPPPASSSAGCATPTCAATPAAAR